MKPTKEIHDYWPKYVAGRAICRWTHPSGKERVYLIARTDGLYSYGGMQFSDAEFEHCWIQQGAGSSFFDSEATAIREIQAAWPWSRTVNRENRPNEKSN
jgi:hypothetical protein